MDDELTLELNNPLTEEQWDAITDVDFDHTDSVTFHTKHGKEVEFVKRRTGRWLRSGDDLFPLECDQCGETNERPTPWCPHCGCKMEVKHDCQ